MRRGIVNIFRAFSQAKSFLFTILLDVVLCARTIIFSVLKQKEQRMEWLIFPVVDNLRVFLHTANWYGLIAAVINVLSNVPYIWSVMYNPKIRPSASTWMIWGTLDAMRFYFMLVAGVVSYQMLGSCIGIILILAAGASMRKLIPWSLIDLGIALGVGGIMWAAYHYGGTPFWMLLASLLALTAGALPMYWKTIKQPYSEPIIPWMMVWLACLFQILSTPQEEVAALFIGEWRRVFEAMGVSAWIMFLTSILIVTIIFRRRRVEKPAEIEAHA